MKYAIIYVVAFILMQYLGDLAFIRKEYLGGGAYRTISEPWLIPSLVVLWVSAFILPAFIFKD